MSGESSGRKRRVSVKREALENKQRIMTEVVERAVVGRKAWG